MQGRLRAAFAFALRPGRARPARAARAAPVTAGRLPGWRSTNAPAPARRRPRPRPAAAAGRGVGRAAPRHAGSSAARRCIRCVLSAPPPQTSSSLRCAARAPQRVGARRARSARPAWPARRPAARSAACRSCGVQPGGLNRSRPGALGRRPREVRLGQQSLPAAPASTWPLRRPAPVVVVGRPRWRWHQWSISALAGPQSKPSIGPSARAR